MPNPEKILLALNTLPVIGEHDKPGGDEIWKANENGGHFRLWRCAGELYSRDMDIIDAEGCIVSVSGSKESRESIIEDFTNVLGKPRHKKERKSATYLTWLKPVKS